jgi:hypothetical protein
MATSLREPSAQPMAEAPARDQALDNLAVVRTWWTVLESEWRGALAERDGLEGPGFTMVDPHLRAAVAPFERFEASVDDMLAFGEQVVVSLSLRGRIRGCELAAREAWVCVLEEGTVLEVRPYPGVSEALASFAECTPEAPALGAAV